MKATVKKPTEVQKPQWFAEPAQLQQTPTQQTPERQGYTAQTLQAAAPQTPAQAQQTQVQQTQVQQTPAQVQQSQDDWLKSMQDMYDRYSREAKARQAQNLSAARLSAQQQAALGGYSPDMAQRALFEQSAGAYKANNDIEGELARLGMEVQGKKYDIAKHNDETAYSRDQDRINRLQAEGYDQWGEIAERLAKGESIADILGYVPLTKTPDYEKSHEYETAQDEYYANLLKENPDDAYAKRYTQSRQAEQNAADTAAQNEAYADAQAIIDGNIGDMPISRIMNALKSTLGEQVRNALSNNTVGNGADLAKHKKDDVIMFKGKPVRLTSNPTWKSEARGGWGRDKAGQYAEFVSLEDGTTGHIWYY